MDEHTSENRDPLIQVEGDFEIFALDIIERPTLQHDQ